MYPSLSAHRTESSPCATEITSCSASVVRPYGRIEYRRQCSLANRVHDNTHARDTGSRQTSLQYTVAAPATALASVLIGHMLWSHDHSRCIRLCGSKSRISFSCLCLQMCNNAHGHVESLRLPQTIYASFTMMDRSGGDVPRDLVYRRGACESRLLETGDHPVDQ